MYLGHFPSIRSEQSGLHSLGGPRCPSSKDKESTIFCSPCSDPQSVAERRGWETESGCQSGVCLTIYGFPTLTQPSPHLLPTKVPAHRAPATGQLQKSPVRKRIEKCWKERRQSTQSLTSQGHLRQHSQPQELLPASEKGERPILMSPHLRRASTLQVCHTKESPRC